jgi:hypothetical protein
MALCVTCVMMLSESITAAVRAGDGAAERGLVAAEPDSRLQGVRKAPFKHRLPRLLWLSIIDAGVWIICGAWVLH